MESLYFDTLIDPRRMALLKERYAEKEKGRVQYCCNQAWMKNGGLTLWNAIAICETSKTSWQMGKDFTNDDLKNHLEAWSFRLVQWLNIKRFLQKTSQAPPIW